jgi:ABC-type bacteriocin/lantibiotic exporter with double-glycine peptidase domain
MAAADWFARRAIPRAEEDAVFLTLPDVRMRDSFDCGAACVEAAAAFWGVRCRPARLANPAQGMAPDTVEAVLRSIGLAVLSGTMAAADLRHLTRTGRPVLCPTGLYGGHWVVVAGVARGRVHYHDPAAGPARLGLAAWDAAWGDTSRSGQAFARWGIACGPG